MLMTKEMSRTVQKHYFWFMAAFMNRNMKFPKIAAIKMEPMKISQCVCIESISNNWTRKKKSTKQNDWIWFISFQMWIMPKNENNSEGVGKKSKMTNGLDCIEYIPES